VYPASTLELAIELVYAGVGAAVISITGSATVPPVYVGVGAAVVVSTTVPLVYAGVGAAVVSIAGSATVQYTYNRQRITLKIILQ
jgi:hypothetical protein